MRTTVSRSRSSALAIAARLTFVRYIATTFALVAREVTGGFLEDPHFLRFAVFCCLWLSAQVRPEIVHNREKYDAFQRKAEGTKAADRSGTAAIQKEVPSGERTPASRARPELVGGVPQPATAVEKNAKEADHVETARPSGADTGGTAAVQEGLPSQERVLAEGARDRGVESPAPQEAVPAAAPKRKVPFAKKAVEHVEPTQPAAVEGSAGQVPAVAEPPQRGEAVLEGKPAESVQGTPGGDAGEAGPVGGRRDRQDGEPGIERVGSERGSVPDTLSGAGGQQPIRRVRRGSQLKPSGAVGNDYHITSADLANAYWSDSAKSASAQFQSHDPETCMKCRMSGG